MASRFHFSLAADFIVSTPLSPPLPSLLSFWSCSTAPSSSLFVHCLRLLVLGKAALEAQTVVEGGRLCEESSGLGLWEELS